MVGCDAGSDCPINVWSGKDHDICPEERDGSDRTSMKDIWKCNNNGQVTEM
jgi:hypothetical protein